MNGAKCIARVIVTAALFVTSTAAGQPVGAHVAGIVRDESGAVLQQATVTVTNVLNGRAITLATGALGDYRAVALMPGDYDVTAEYSGFAPQTRRLTLFVGSDATLNFTLTVSAAIEQRIVTASMGAIETARSQPVSVVTKSDVEALPVLERNFLVLAQLLPGAAPINTTVSRFAVTRFGGVADQRSGYTTLVDGGSVDDAQWGSPTINVSQDAVQEFKVFRNQFDAQYGHALNAVVSVLTRSGTNLYSGSGFYFGRDDSLNARYAFATSDLPFDEQRIGGSIGGPLARNRSHFFGAYERDNVDTVRVIALPAVESVQCPRSMGRFPPKPITIRSSADSIIASAHRKLCLSDTRATTRRPFVPASLSCQIPTRPIPSTDLTASSSSTRGHQTRTSRTSMRLHVLDHAIGTVPRNSDVGIIRPSIRFGQTNFDSQIVSRTVVNVSNGLYVHTPRHDFKVGGEFGFSTNDLDSHGLENGIFDFVNRRSIRCQQCQDLAHDLPPAEADAGNVSRQGSCALRAG